MTSGPRDSLAAHSGLVVVLSGLGALFAYAAAASRRRRSAQYTGTPVATITSPGHVVAGRYANSTTNTVAAPSM